MHENALDRDLIKPANITVTFSYHQVYLPHFHSLQYYFFFQLFTASIYAPEQELTCFTEKSPSKPDWSPSSPLDIWEHGQCRQSKEKGLVE